MGLEIAEQLGWTLPDVILHPPAAGWSHRHLQGAAGVAGAGLGQGPLPRLVAVQASGCAPSSRPGSGAQSRFWPDSQTLAFGINVPKALGDFLVLDALYRTEGAPSRWTIAPSSARSDNSPREGSFVCPEGRPPSLPPPAAGSGLDTGGERVVVLNTGAGIKYPDAITVVPQRLRRDGRIPA